MRTRLLYIIGSLAIVAALLSISGYSLIEVGSGAIKGAFTAPDAWHATIRWSTAYILIGAGVIVSVRAGFFNLGAQGQFYLGSLGAVSVSLYWPNGPRYLVIATSLLAGIVCGALWAYIPGWLRVKHDANEVITTLMTNFLAILVLRSLSRGVLQDDTGSGEASSSRTIDPSLRISNGSGFSVTTLAISIFVLIALWLILTRTRFGIISGIVGRNPLMARWQGIDVGDIGMKVFLLSGASAGLAGAVEVLGANGRVSSGFEADLGMTAILVAIVSGLGAIGLAMAAIFFGAMQAALLYIPIVSDVPPSSLQLMSGMIALFVTAKFVISFRDNRKQGLNKSGESL